jgi:hypothetical protein
VKVRCTRLLPTLPATRRLGRHYHPGKQEFPVVEGHEYQVYGLRIWSGALWVDIETGQGYLVAVPLDLFEIIDGAVPELWCLRIDTDGDLALLPAEFHDEFFLDDLVEGKRSAVLAFEKVKTRMHASSDATTGFEER